MKDLLIFGNGGFAKEVLMHAESTGEFKVIGFVDTEDPDTSVTVQDRAIPVIAEADLSSAHQQCAFAIGIGNPKVIKKIAQNFSQELYFPNIVHPRAIVGEKDVDLGQGNIITPSVIFTTACHVGSFNIFNLSCTIGHDTTIGDHNVINPGVNISGGVTIGNDILIGTNATILQNMRINNNSVVGAASLVNREVAGGSVVVGIPAKPLQSTSNR